MLSAFSSASRALESLFFTHFFHTTSSVPLLFTSPRHHSALRLRALYSTIASSFSFIFMELPAHENERAHRNTLLHNLRYKLKLCGKFFLAFPGWDHLLHASDDRRRNSACLMLNVFSEKNTFYRHKLWLTMDVDVQELVLPYCVLVDDLIIGCSGVLFYTSDRIYTYFHVATRRAIARWSILVE